MTRALVWGVESSGRRRGWRGFRDESGVQDEKKEDGPYEHSVRNVLTEGHRGLRIRGLVGSVHRRGVK